MKEMKKELLIIMQSIFIAFIFSVLFVLLNKLSMTLHQFGGLFLTVLIVILSGRYAYSLHEVIKKL